MNKRFLLIFLCLLSVLRAEDVENMKYPDILPWFTGPILTPVKQILKPGQYGMEPFFIYQKITGEYDNSWRQRDLPNFSSFQQLTILGTGITNFMDIQVFPQWWVQHSQGATSARFGDLPVSLNFQLIRDDEDPRVPTLLILVRESFPTGQYQKLDPDLFDTDGVGSGSFETTFGFTLAHLFHCTGYNFLSLRANFSYTIAKSTDVEGFNVYGGGFGTDARVTPGNLLEIFLSFEYSFTRKWAITCDLAYFSKSEDRFSGTLGCNRDKTVAELGFPHSDLISLAPGLEYNFSDTSGILFGSWFTLAGRNADRFYSGVFAFYKVF